MLNSVDTSPSPGHAAQSVAPMQSGTTSATSAGAHVNPLLALDGLVRFDAVQATHVGPAIAHLLAAAQAAVAGVTAQAIEAATWEAVVAPIDEATDALGRAWAAVSHLNAVVDSEAMRDAYNASLPAVTRFWTELSQNLSLHAAFKQLAADPGFAQWPQARRKVIQNELRDFRLGGAQLAGPAKDRLRAVRERQSQVSTRFSENLLDATNAFALDIDDESRLDGIAQDVRAMYRETAERAGLSGWRISLHQPSLAPALQYATDRFLRETLYRAYHGRAAEYGPPQWDNSANMVELLALREEQAHLLGYDNFGELSLVPKMASNTAEVLTFLRDLAARARPYAERDLHELREFAAESLGLAELQAWDISFASERLQQARYAYSSQEVKSYFPQPQVLAGLFNVIETLFNVAIRRDDAPVWHPDVTFYRIATHDGALVGQFYLDLYARDHKQGGAWQDDARVRRRSLTGLQTPVSVLVCNFSPPVGGKPAVFTHDEVVTLFHEFGHGLHHMLTRVDEASVAGIRGVEWDAVELPSQFMENFAWQWAVLERMSRHVGTGAALPRALFQRMLAARHFQSGLATLRQVEFALFDMLAHTRAAAELTSAASIIALAKEVRDEVAVIFPPPWHRGMHGFGHIFAGGYAAGYYSYKWAEVLSADCFGVFEEAGAAVNAEQGKRFLDEILAVGGSRPALESFVAFRGRPPRIDALLRQSGMTA